MTPYEVLGIGPKAKPAEITAAYRILAQIFHPDRFSGAPTAVQKEAQRRMSEVNDAYAFFRGANNSAGENSAPAPGRPGGGGHSVARGGPSPGSGRGSGQGGQAGQGGEHPAGQGRQPAQDGRAKLALAGMGEALHTNKITCRECKSIQWLPDGWRERLDDNDFYCSICSRLILAR